MSSPAALYRRYRPDTFKDVIGQEHVTEPLMTALRKDRVNHAYLFSGPRGCGKTTSARILARCLNCEQGPTPDPCGVCPSCVELARGGSGSLDVIEIDAASHGGVDDARDLRERATFAPVRDRYKIFIIDEAHMVTSAGFNALLKIVEEPPEHIKFIFATTEPDKVIGTIRSRTHHYPFRLVPPEPLLAYLEQLCAAESVPVAPGVLSLVVRAGGGSVRDSLSVLDQLMAGAGPDGLDYELAVALLGYTHAALLDDVVDAVAAGDSGTVFRAVDRVIQTGHDPRRFVEDLLERFRDLIIVQALPEAAESILRGVPADQLARMRVQAQNLGAAELSRAADVTNEAFNEMTGATSPRLHLELLCARLMLPGAEATERGWAARVDRLERRLAFAHDGGEPPAAASVPTPVSGDAAPRPRPETPSTSAPPVPQAPQPAPAVERSEAPAAVVETGNTQPEPGASQPPTSAPQAPTSATQPPTSAPQAPTSATQAPQGGGAGSVEMFRRAWPEILDTLAKVKRSTWALVGPNASVAGFDGRTLALAFGTSGLASAFMRSDHADNLRRAIQLVLGVDCQIDAVTGGNGPGVVPSAGARGGGSPKAPADPGQDTPVPAVESRLTASAESRPARPVGGSAPSAVSAASAPAEPSEADIAWGLAPAPAQSTASAQPAGASPNHAPAQGVDRPVTPRAEPAIPGSAPGTAAPATSAPAAPAIAPSAYEPPAAGPPTSEPPAAEPPTPAMSAPETGLPAAQASRAVAPSGPSPSSPYDDIPYSNEEPPNEWDEPYPEDDGYARAAQPNRAPQAPQPAGLSGTAPAAPGTSISMSSPSSTASDPWSYARESSPGVWTVGSEPNVGADGASASAPSTVPAAPAATAPSSAPAYAPAAAQAPQNGASPTQPAPSANGASDGGRRLSMYERLSRSAAERGPQEQQAQAPQAYVDDIPSADDEAIEESILFGRAAVERILGGKLIEERALDGTVIPPR
ncbi:DNA polymerase III subunit gamma and tau [Sinomonas mesophila]|uniref:DNA polymerase III subunit gamma and tau n=1 Tax=Sinomonas mesophila TaxID=1531955 RepID=UPI0009878440|nr:DNA polymerase III subunit gamma and tau [Sinomonas mesophila]